jgi:hypothetical protein
VNYVFLNATENFGEVFSTSSNRQKTTAAHKTQGAKPVPYTPPKLLLQQNEDCLILVF